MMKKRWLAVTAFLIVFIPSYVLASDLTNATYFGTIVISNDGSTTGNVATTMTLNCTSLIDQGYVDSDFERIAVRDSEGHDAIFGPSVNDTIPWFFWVDSIPGHGNINYIIYTGNTSLNSTKYYFPAPKGMTASYSATLTLGDNFTIEQSGILTANQTLIYQPGVIKTYTSDYYSGSSLNITSAIMGETAWRTPNGHNDPNSYWANEAYAYDDNVTTYSTSNLTSQNNWTEFLEFYLSEPISMTSVRYYVSSNSTGTFGQIDIDYSDDGKDSWTNGFSGAATEGSSVEQEIFADNVTWVRIRGYQTGAGNQALYIDEIDFGQDTAFRFITATGISSDNHTVSTIADTSKFHIYIDGVAEAWSWLPP